MKSLNSLLKEGLRLSIDDKPESKFEEIKNIIQSLGKPLPRGYITNHDKDWPFNVPKNPKLLNKIQEIFGKFDVMEIYDESQFGNKFAELWNKSMHMVNRHNEEDDYNIILDEWDNWTDKNGYEDKYIIIADDADNPIMFKINNDMWHSFIAIGSMI